MATNDFINRQVNRIISDNSPTTLMGVRGLLRFNRIPPWLVYLVIIMIVASWIPLAWAVRMRFVKTEQPRIHLFQDMDIQPRFGPQSANALFANNMAMRPPVPGTVARGKLEEDDFYNRGYQILGMGPDGQPQVQFFDGFPDQVAITPELLVKGKELYARFCYVCHGFDGYGNGPVHIRASQRPGMSPNWIPPSNLHEETIRQRPSGHLYNTVNNGIRSMAGYGAQIQHPEDRWAVVAYVRALQLSQSAEAEMVPPELQQQMPVRPTMRGGRPFVVEEDPQDHQEGQDQEQPEQPQQPQQPAPAAGG